jgi:hypothetical protein
MKLKPLFCLWDFFLILKFKEFLFEETFREMISNFKGYLHDIGMGSGYHQTQIFLSGREKLHTVHGISK